MRGLTPMEAYKRKKDMEEQREKENTMINRPLRRLKHRSELDPMEAYKRKKDMEEQREKEDRLRASVTPLQESRAVDVVEVLTQMGLSDCKIVEEKSVGFMGLYVDGLRTVAAKFLNFPISVQVTNTGHVAIWPLTSQLGLTEDWEHVKDDLSDLPTLLLPHLKKMLRWRTGPYRADIRRNVPR
jgi:hypothetical protein